VMCHGGLGLDSLRFHYRSELDSRLFCNEVVFLHLGRSHTGSCALDLLHLLFTSVDADVRTSFMADFICSVYYENFAKTVGAIDPDIRLFTKKSFIREVYHKLPLSLPYSLSSLLPLLEEEGEDACLATLRRVLADTIQFRANIRATIP